MKTTSGNVNILDVLPYVPHRPPMVWVDEIAKFEATSGECIIHMKAGGTFLGPDGLRKSSCLEFIAQSYGYCSVAYDHSVDPNAKPLKNAFLASFKDVVFADASVFAKVKIDDRLHVYFSDVRKLGSIVVFNGRALHNGAELARANIKVFCET